jgi:hypothetical protein
VFAGYRPDTPLWRPIYRANECEAKACELGRANPCEPGM